jgi:hypothetical protein
MKYFFTFGAGEKNFIEAGIRLVLQAKETKLFDKTLLFTDIDLRKDDLFWKTHGAFVKSNPKGYGYWIWKPYLILKLLEKMYEGDVLVYADSGCEIHVQNTSLLEDVVRKTKKDFIVGSTIATERNWTKKDLLLHMNMMTIDAMFSPQRQGTALSILKNERTTNLVKEWYEIASHYPFLDDSPGLHKNFHFFMEHRHDQSIFSLLTKKHNLYSKFSLDKAIGLLRNKTGISQFSTNNNVSLNSERGLKLFEQCLADSKSFFSTSSTTSVIKEFSGKKDTSTNKNLSKDELQYVSGNGSKEINFETSSRIGREDIPAVDIKKKKSDPEITLLEMESTDAAQIATLPPDIYADKKNSDPEKDHNSEKAVRIQIEILGSETESDSDDEIEGDASKSASQDDTDNTPFRIENAQCNVAFSLKSAPKMERLNEKRCKKAGTPLPKELDAPVVKPDPTPCGKDCVFVVARYQEDIRWLSPIMKECIIYNKGFPLHLENEVLLKNVGRESDTYLQFIIRNYENLPDVVVFTQGNIKDHIPTDNIKFLLELKSQAQQQGVSKPMAHYIQEEYSPWNPEFNKIETRYMLPDCYKDYPKTFREWFTQTLRPNYPNPLMFFSKGLFAVRKDKIRKHSLDYYKNLISHVNHNINPVEGHFFERAWFYVFS